MIAFYLLQYCVDVSHRRIVGNKLQDKMTVKEYREKADMYSREHRRIPDEKIIENLDFLQRRYFKNQPTFQPVYGSNVSGSLMDPKLREWNFNKLDSILQECGRVFKGVTTSYLYIGMWETNFAWHKEDMDLGSISYNHLGAPEQWYR